MDRKELEQYILSKFPAQGDYPWLRYPGYQVFRHESNGKWFALIMDLPRQKLGLSGDGTIDVVNLKCPPLMTGSLREETGIFPAYHMNKESWITAALDGSVPADKLKTLLDISFDLTGVKKKRKKTEVKDGSVL